MNDTFVPIFIIYLFPFSIYFEQKITKIEILHCLKLKGPNLV